MITIQKKEKCCGCEACIQACPKKCINFLADEEGFFYPKVNLAACVNCGICEKVCPVLNPSGVREPISSYAGKNNIESERANSSSGGVFILISKKVIESGGVVFGARFDSDWNVVHSYSETIEGLASFMGSKYVQSRMDDCYKKAGVFLKEGRKVLFSGTPCQIAGLRNYLRHDYDNLLTIDIICHGVPSSLIWQKYLSEIKENARKGENSVSLPLNHSISECDTLVSGDEYMIESISFRDKRLGWKKYSFALTLAKASADGKKNTVLLSHRFIEDPFMKAFLRNITLRPSCYACPTKEGKSGSDITIADFWGVDEVIPGINDDKGTSLIIINTQKGEDVVGKYVTCKKTVDFHQAILHNYCYYVPEKKHPHRRKFFRAVSNNKMPIIQLMNMYSKVPWIQKKWVETKKFLVKIRDFVK